MKKVIVSFISFLLVLSLCSCGESTKNRTAENKTKTVSDILNEAKNGSKENKTSSEKPSSTDKESQTEDIKCDVDLTDMNTNMIYAEVSNMMNNPGDYVGKTVKMKGNFSVYETDARNYYACIIADATACCSQGIEFVLKDERKYPDQYPALGTEITVIGKFETYYEGEQMYCQLSGAYLE